MVGIDRLGMVGEADWGRRPSQRVNAGPCCEWRLPVVANASSATRTASSARPASSRQCIRKRCGDRASAAGTASNGAVANASRAPSGSPDISATTPAMLAHATCTIGSSSPPGTLLMRPADRDEPVDVAPRLGGNGGDGEGGHLGTGIAAGSIRRRDIVEHRVDVAVAEHRERLGPRAARRARPGHRSTAIVTPTNHRLASSTGSTLMVERTSPSAATSRASRSPPMRAAFPARVGSPAASRSSTTRRRSSAASSASSMPGRTSLHRSWARCPSPTAAISGTRSASAARSTGAPTTVLTNSSVAVPASERT